MIQQTIREIEMKLAAENIAEARKKELLQLVATLKAEIADLEKTCTASREKEQAIKSSVEDLRSSVEGFEQSHPKLVQAVNSISNTLSNLGI